jgi:pimeloyl-ACP methyl ester carboxylesterase
MIAKQHKSQHSTLSTQHLNRFVIVGWLVLLWLTASVGWVSAQTTTPATGQDDGTIVRQALTLELSDGFKTKAEIDAPSGKPGPFPAVLMLGGSGANDMDGATPATPSIKVYKEMLDNLVKRGFIVYKYNKRGLDTNGRVVNQKASDERTNEVLVKDGVAALRQFLADPKVDKNAVFILAHSQGTLIAPQVAGRTQVAIRGLVLTGTIADWSLAFDYQLVTRYLQVAQEADTNKDGLLAPDEIASVLNSDQKAYENARRATLLDQSVLGYFQVFTRPGQPTTLGNLKSEIDSDKDGKLSIEKELKPALQAQRESLLTNQTILRNSGESAAALKSLLDGPKLVDVLPTLKTSVYFQQGDQDERAPLEPVRQVSNRLSAAGISNVLRVYAGIGHTLVPADLSLRLTPQQIATTAKFVPNEILNEQASWLVARYASANPASNQPASGTGGGIPASGLGGGISSEDTTWQVVALSLLVGTGGSTYLLLQIKRRKLKNR